MNRFRSLLNLVAIASLASAVVIFAASRPARAAEIIGAVGINQAPSGGTNPTMYAVALRSGFLPRTKLDIQVGYHTEKHEIAGQSFDLNSTPATLSLWVSPVPMLYAGGGVGAYVQTVKYNGNLYPDNTDTQFGAHLGGGLHFGLLPMVGLDLQGRYVFLKDQATALSNGSFNPSYWSVQAGLAIGM